MERGALFKETVRTAYVASWGERYSDEALAERAHVSSNTLRRLWTGAIPELGTLIAIANASGISVLDALMALQGHGVRPEAPALDRIADTLEEIKQLMPPPRRAWSTEERERRLDPASSSLPEDAVDQATEWQREQDESDTPRRASNGRGRNGAR